MCEVFNSGQLRDIQTKSNLERLQKTTYQKYKVSYAKKTHIKTVRNLEIQIENYQEEKVIWRKISVRNANSQLQIEKLKNNLPV